MSPVPLLTEMSVLGAPWNSLTRTIKQCLLAQEIPMATQGRCFAAPDCFRTRKYSCAQFQWPTTASCDSWSSKRRDISKLRPSMWWDDQNPWATRAPPCPIRCYASSLLRITDREQAGRDVSPWPGGYPISCANGHYWSHYIRHLAWLFVGREALATAVLAYLRRRKFPRRTNPYSALGHEQDLICNVSNDIELLEARISWDASTLDRMETAIVSPPRSRRKNGNKCMSQEPIEVVVFYIGTRLILAFMIINRQESSSTRQSFRNTIIPQDQAPSDAVLKRRIISDMK
jgi:hypothetical protein